jgi:hypothetical protein
MEIGTRREKLAAMLEGHLANCNAALAACAEGRTPEDLMGEWPFKRMLSLMKMSAQLANTIARLDAQASKNRENRGSIP